MYPKNMEVYYTIIFIIIIVSVIIFKAGFFYIV